VQQIAVIPTLKGFVVVKLKEIIKCEAKRNYTIIHIQNNKPIMVSRPLVAYEKLLKDAGFIRVHKTWLINLLHITEYYRGEVGEGGIVVMSNGSTVEISRRRKEEFLSQVKDIFPY
jgi:two-component system LytT family response regulator